MSDPKPSRRAEERAALLLNQIRSAFAAYTKVRAQDDAAGSYIVNQIRAAEDAARRDEREACAKVCDAQKVFYDGLALGCADPTDHDDDSTQLWYEEKAGVCHQLARDIRAGKTPDAGQSDPNPRP